MYPAIRSMEVRLLEGNFVATALCFSAVIALNKYMVMGATPFLYYSMSALKKIVTATIRQLKAFLISSNLLIMLG